VRHSIWRRGCRSPQDGSVGSVSSLAQAWRILVTEQGKAPIVSPPARAPRRRIPSRKPSHWARNSTIVVIGVFVLLAAIGSASSRESIVTGPTAPPDAIASQSDTGAEASESASPTPGSASLLSIEGTGPATSDEFRASGLSVDVGYTYSCPTEASFTLNFYGTNGSPLLPDVLASEFGTSGSNTTNEPLNDTTGPFTVEVDSSCEWTVEVTGTP